MGQPGLKEQVKNGTITAAEALDKAKIRMRDYDRFRHTHTYRWLTRRAKAEA